MRQERELAEDTGAIQHRGSGAVSGYKGDVRKRGKFRAECKFTKAKSFTVKREDLDKIYSESSFGEVPVMDIAFLDQNGRTEERWVLLPYSEFTRLFDAPSEDS